MQTIRFATIGTSPITERLVDAIAHVADADYVGCYSRDLDRAHAFGEARGATLFFDDLDELAACNHIDAVYVASPNMAHFSQASLLAAAGKHVLVEKSMCSNASQAKRLFEVADEAGVVAMEAMRNLHGPGFAAIEDALAELGEARQASVRFSKLTSRMARLRAGERLPIFDTHCSAGALMDIGVYCVEPAVALFGKPDAVQARLITTGVPGEEAGSAYATIDLGGEILLSYEGEDGHTAQVANVSYGKVCDGLTSSEIQCDGGTLLWDETSSPANLRRSHAVEAAYGFAAAHGELEQIEFDAVENDMAYEVEDFCQAIRGDAEARELVGRCRQVTLASLEVMDEVRAQAGVRFPADDEL